MRNFFVDAEMRSKNNLNKEQKSLQQFKTYYIY